MEVWRLGGLEAWRLGGSELWTFGSFDLSFEPCTIFFYIWTLNHESLEPSLGSLICCIFYYFDFLTFKPFSGKFAKKLLTLKCSEPTFLQSKKVILACTWLFLSDLLCSCCLRRAIFIWPSKKNFIMILNWKKTRHFQKIKVQLNDDYVGRTAQCKYSCLL